jgi:hypothetical protein
LHPVAWQPPQWHAELHVWVTLEQPVTPLQLWLVFAAHSCSPEHAPNADQPHVALQVRV